jgi:hypothetical protein
MTENEIGKIVVDSAIKVLKHGYLDKMVKGLR